MILGYKEFIDELLLEARSPEEVARMLAYKYPDVPESLIRELVDTDPTKKKTYAGWVLQVERNPRKINDYLKSGRLARIFTYFREMAKEGASLVDKNSIEEAERYLPDSSDVLNKTGDPKVDDYTIGIETPEWIVATPNTYEASKRLGENTKWCTADAYGNGEYYWDEYTSAGRLWVNFDRREKETLEGVTYPYKRYQFCFERKAFLDAHDDPFNWETLDMPDDIKEFYVEKGYDLSELEKSEEERWEEYSEQRYNDSVVLFDDVDLMREWDDDLTWNDDDDNANYFIYDTYNDSQDPLYNSEAYTKDSVVFVSEMRHFAVLKEKYNDGRYSIVIRQRGRWDNDDINVYSNIENYKILGEDGEDYVAFIDLNGELVYLSDMGQMTPDKGPGNKRFSDYAEIFWNAGLVTDDEIYIEVADEGAHSLYLVDFTEYCLKPVIYNDIPADGDVFTLRDGLIHGKYATYSPDGKRVDGDNPQYVPVKTLMNHGLTVCRNQDTGKLNVIMKTDGERGAITERLFPEDFDEFVADLSDSALNAILVKDESGYYLLSIASRKRASGVYPFAQTDKDRTFVVAAKEKNGDRFILTGKGDIQVSEVRGIQKNGRIPVKIMCEDGKKRFRVLNQRTGRFEMDWVDKSDYLGYGQAANFILASSNSGKVYLCDWTENIICARDVALSPRPDILHDTASGQRFDDSSLYTISFTDGAMDIFSTRLGEFLIRNNRPKNITASMSGGRGGTPVLCAILLDYGDKSTIAELRGMRVLTRVMDINTTKYKAIPRLSGKVLTITVPDANNTVFELHLDTKELEVLDIDRERKVYTEMPIGDASPEKQRLAAEIFPELSASPSQMLAERMDRTRRDFHLW